MVFAVASNTGWAESFILWELSLCRALQYWHCWLYSQGIWTVPKRPPADDEFARLKGHLAMMEDQFDE